VWFGKENILRRELFNLPESQFSHLSNEVNKNGYVLGCLGGGNAIMYVNAGTATHCGRCTVSLPFSFVVLPGPGGTRTF
jgi:hypothetical protein